VFDRNSNLGSFRVPHSRWFKQLKNTNNLSSEQEILTMIVMQVTNGLKMSNSQMVAYLEVINTMIG
jgi:hypothetical protein